MSVPTCWRPVGESGGAASSCKRRLRARAAPAWICSLDPSIRAPDHPTNPRARVHAAPQRRRQQQPLAAGSRRRAHKLYSIAAAVGCAAKGERKTQVPPSRPPTALYAPRAKSNTHSLSLTIPYIQASPRLPVYMQFILLRATPVSAQDSREPKERALFSVLCVWIFPALSSSSCAAVHKWK